MTRRDIAWALGGFWACAGLLLFTMWWVDQKTGVQSVTPSVAWTKMLEQVEAEAETHKQMQAVAAINEAAFVKKWAAFEKRLKQLEMAMAAQTALLNQYRGQQEQIVVASQPSQPLPSPQLVQLAREVGFGKVDVR